MNLLPFLVDAPISSLTNIILIIYCAVKFFQSNELVLITICLANFIFLIVNVIAFRSIFLVYRDFSNQEKQFGINKFLENNQQFKEKPKENDYGGNSKEGNQNDYEMVRKQKPIEEEEDYYAELNVENFPEKKSTKKSSDYETFPSAKSDEYDAPHLL